MKINKLYCKLTKHILTGGIFIAKGTPVQVLCWENEDSILVRANSSLHPGDKPKEGLDRFHGYIDATTYASVRPDDLEFEKMIQINSYM